MSENILDTTKSQSGIDEATVSPRPISLRYGMILGLASLILSIGLMMSGLIDYSGQKSNILSNILSWGLIIGFLYVAINEHKMKELGGYISLGRCAKIGFWVGLFSGVITAIGMGIYFQFIDPSFFDNVFEQMRDNFEAKGMSEADIDNAISMTKKFMSPTMMAVFGIVGSLIFDTVIGLLIGLILRKERTPFN